MIGRSFEVGHNLDYKVLKKSTIICNNFHKTFNSDGKFPFISIDLKVICVTLKIVLMGVFSERGREVR